VNIETAALKLHEEMSNFNWYLSVGVGVDGGTEKIFVYVRSLRHKELDVIRSGWMGFEVLVRNSGPVRAISNHENAFRSCFV